MKTNAQPSETTVAMRSAYFWLPVALGIAMSVLGVIIAMTPSSQPGYQDVHITTGVTTHDIITSDASIRANGTNGNCITEYNDDPLSTKEHPRPPYPVDEQCTVRFAQPWYHDVRLPWGILLIVGGLAWLAYLNSIVQRPASKQ